MYIISGCNGSGKTTASYTLLPELLDCSEFVNSDEFAKSLAPFHPETAYITASRYMLKKLRYLFTRREDFCIETTLATRSLLKMVRMAQDQGYFVTVVYLWLNDPEIAIRRVAARVEAGGHDVPPDVIRRRYFTGLEYFFNLYLPVCDKWMLVDNSEADFRIIAEGSAKGTTVRDLALYNQISNQIKETHDSP
ncbi:MAG: AAA family ATPase [Bacteroidales bacterium]|mgnify:CR=1 FL=1|jgi:predicted ABC-type ATPase|nr:AAA family ATPase [Bacteroidales bacterium]MBR6864638.1 AAA family ATPase [Bacteroidales bacterium]